MFLYFPYCTRLADECILVQPRKGHERTIERAGSSHHSVPKAAIHLETRWKLHWQIILDSHIFQQPNLKRQHGLGHYQG